MIEITDDDKEVANIFDNFVANLVKNLNIKMIDDHISDTENLTGNVNIAVKRYKNHPTQTAFTCSKLTIETLEQGVKCVRKLTIETWERRQWCHSHVFIVNCRTYFTPCSSVSIVNFEHVIAGWEALKLFSV